jgi:hypothetical protein
MAVKSLAYSPHQSTTRIDRGRNLYAEHGDEIRFDPVEKVWLVPSQHDLTSTYEVTLGALGEYCECVDFEIRHPQGGCKHIVAATLRKAKTFQCQGCGERYSNRELYEVVDPGHLTFFEGDALCEECALNHGVL